MNVETIYQDANGLTVAHESGESHSSKSIVPPGHRYRIEGFNLFLFQQGPVPSAGVNGITNEALLAILIHRIDVLNAALPCPENAEAAAHLRSALAALEQRTARRVAAGVEGTMTEALEPCPLPPASDAADWEARHPDVSAEIHRRLASGDNIGAIHYARDVLRVGLRDAKLLVEGVVAAMYPPTAQGGGNPAAH